MSSKRLRQSVLLPVGLLAFGAIYSLAFLGLSSRWWFEDDPALFAYTAGIHNPVRIFTDPNVLRHFTAGSALVPMQILSYWLDINLAGFSPEFAYAHQVCSFLLTLLLLYLVLSDWLHDRMAAAVASVAWALLPATAVIVQFLATRHYLEGLLFSLLSLYLLERLRDKDGRHGYLAQAGILACAAVAMLYKEIYAPVLPLVLLIIAWRHRERIFAFLTVLLSCAYAIYRLWAIPSTLQYADVPLINGFQYLKFLSKYPYTLTSNYGGYLLSAFVLALCIFAARKKGGKSVLACFLAIFALSLAIIVPVTYPLFGSIRRPDPWYRIVFFPNTTIVLSAGFLAARYASRRVQLALALTALVVLLPGVEKTRRLWAGMTCSAELEGKFYLNNPDKVLLSQQEAFWFIPGIHWMYGVKTPHYVLLKDLGTAQTTPGVPLWRLSNGIFVPEYNFASGTHRAAP